MSVKNGVGFGIYNTSYLCKISLEAQDVRLILDCFIDDFYKYSNQIQITQLPLVLNQVCINILTTNLSTKLLSF